MNSPGRRLLIVSPLYLPASGGAAIYYEMLSRHLIESDQVDSVTIISEAMPGHPRRESDLDGRRTIIRALPHFSHRGKRDAITAAALAGRQAIVSLLPAAAPFIPADVVVMHGAFHIHPNFIAPSMKLGQALSGLVPKLPAKIARRLGGAGDVPEFYADMRDALTPAKRLGALGEYDGITSCGANVSNHLRSVGLEPQAQIPVPIERDVTLAAQNRSAVRDTCLADFDIPGDYLLFANGVNTTKGIDLAVELRDEMARRGRPLTLVVAGRNRETVAAVDAGIAAGHIVVLGSLPQPDILRLGLGATAVINLSPSEGVPRSTLEALDLGATTLLPAGVPEFEGFSEIADLSSAAECADRLEALLDAESAEGLYPIERHDITNLTPQYAEMWFGPNRDAVSELGNG